MKIADDLIEPTGELSKGLFPDDASDAEFEGRLQSYLNTAYGKLDAAAVTGDVTRDNAAEAYAYFRAYDHIYRRLSATPMQVTLTDQGSRTYSRDQIAAFRNLAADYLMEWQQTVPDLTPANAIPPSAPAKIIPTW